jgi:hypothetical protein
MKMVHDVGAGEGMPHRNRGGDDLPALREIDKMRAISARSEIKGNAKSHGESCRLIWFRYLKIGLNIQHPA